MNKNFLNFSLLLLSAFILNERAQSKEFNFTNRNHYAPKPAGSGQRTLFQGLFKRKEPKEEVKKAHAAQEREAPAPVEGLERPNVFQRMFTRTSSSQEKTPRISLMGPTSAGSMARVNSAADVTTKRYVDARYLDTVFKGKLAGKGSTVIKAAHANGIDPVFFASAMAFETGWGTSSKIRNHNNPGGLTGGSSGRYMSFKTVDEGIYAMAERLRNRYVDRNLTTVGAIARVYAPPGAGNDPNGTNGSWPGTVSGIMNKIVAGSSNI